MLFLGDCVIDKEENDDVDIDILISDILILSKCIYSSGNGVISLRNVSEPLCF